MALSAVAEGWIEQIDEAVIDCQNFSSTPAHKDALREIFDELERYGGRGAVNQLGEETLELIENGRHPKASRLRERARVIAIREFDAKLPAGSALLNSRNG